MQRTFEITQQHDTETGDLFIDEQELTDLLTDLLGAARRIGGQVSVATIRQKRDGNGPVETTGYLVRYTDRVPVLHGDNEAPVEAGADEE